MAKQVYTIKGGERKIEQQSVTVVNATAKTVDVAVPSAEEWGIESIKIINPDDVARTCNITHYKEAAATNYLRQLGAVTNLSAGGRYQVPNTVTAESSVTKPPVTIGGGGLVTELSAVTVLGT